MRRPAAALGLGAIAPAVPASPAVAKNRPLPDLLPRPRNFFDAAETDLKAGFRGPGQ